MAGVRVPQAHARRAVSRASRSSATSATTARATWVRSARCVPRKACGEAIESAVAAAALHEADRPQDRARRGEPCLAGACSARRTCPCSGACPADEYAALVDDGSQASTASPNVLLGAARTPHARARRRRALRGGRRHPRPARARSPARSSASGSCLRCGARVTSCSRTRDGLVELDGGRLVEGLMAPLAPELQRAAGAPRDRRAPGRRAVAVRAAAPRATDPPGRRRARVDAAGVAQLRAGGQRSHRTPRRASRCIAQGPMGPEKRT